jgi:mannose-6-phosphate isomerase-like protein (cupin superfamily)
MVAGEHLKFQARRVVTGVNCSGKSVVVLDELASPRRAGPSSTVVDIWQVDVVPPSDRAMDSLRASWTMDPPPGGFTVGMASFPPDSEGDRSAGFGDLPGANDSSGQDVDDGGIGMHVTETVDIVTVLSGELYLVLEECETLLHQGDTVIQRGTRHSWSNRSDAPVTTVCTRVRVRR